MFQPLEKPQPRYNAFAAGFSVTIAFTVAILLINALFPTVIPQATRLLADNLTFTPAPVPQTPQVKLKRLPVQPIIVKNTPAPRQTVIEAPQPHYPPQVEVQAFNKMPDVPVTVVPKVKMNEFSTGSSAPQTTRRPAVEVQTGGFGDPNGIPATGKPGKAVNIAGVGSFDLPQGSGHGNGLGGRHPGVTESTGFGNGVAVSPTGHAYRVTPSDFDDHVVLDNKTPITVQIKTVPAQIISKPMPQYTEEARRLKVEGIVRVQVRLLASGNVEVVKVLNTLGHGLDNNAVSAAQQVKFKPAQLEGRDTDSTVVLSIVFQLAS